jgi:hypothetical protein
MYGIDVTRMASPVIGAKVRLARTPVRQRPFDPDQEGAGRSHAAA